MANLSRVECTRWYGFGKGIFGIFAQSFIKGDLSNCEDITSTLDNLVSKPVKDTSYDKMCKVWAIFVAQTYSILKIDLYVMETIFVQ